LRAGLTRLNRLFSGRGELARAVEVRIESAISWMMAAEPEPAQRLVPVSGKTFWTDRLELSASVAWLSEARMTPSTHARATTIVTGAT
jgi:hypothetical protein